MATVKFYLNKPKKDGRLRKDEVSIVAKVTVSKLQRFEIPTGEKIIPELWDAATQEVRKKFKYHIDFNLRLSKFKNELLNMYRDHDGSFEEFKHKATMWARGDTVAKKSFWEVLSQFIEQCRREKDDKTARKFVTLQNTLHAYDSSLTFSRIDHNFYDDFKSHLYGIQNPNYRGFRLRAKGDYYVIKKGEGEVVPLLDETVFKYFINLTTFLKWAAKRGYPVNPCFTGWEIIRRRYDDVITLTDDELQKLITHTFSKPHLQVAVDYLLIECFTGQRISDIKRFDLKDFTGATWTFHRYKGRRLNSKQVSITFAGYMRPALLILEKYNYKMPVVSEQKINKAIKAACKEAGIDSYTFIERWAGNKLIRIEGQKHEFISTHTGRKTFITLALSHGVPPKVIMDLVGISDYQTLKHYEGKTTEKVANDYMQKLGELVPMTLKKIG